MQADLRGMSGGPAQPAVLFPWQGDTNWPAEKDSPYSKYHQASYILGDSGIDSSQHQYSTVFYTCNIGHVVQSLSVFRSIMGGKFYQNKEINLSCKLPVMFAKAGKSEFKQTSKQHITAYIC